MLCGHLLLLGLVSGLFQLVASEAFTFGTVLSPQSDHGRSSPPSSSKAPISPFRFSSQKIRSPVVAAAAKTERRRSVAMARTRATSRSRGIPRRRLNVLTSSRGRARQSPTGTSAGKRKTPPPPPPAVVQSNSRKSRRRKMQRIPSVTKVTRRLITEENEIIIGQSPCARGIPGQYCRRNLQQTAMACTSGKCHECQKCGTIPATDWISCCRDHFLCCRRIGRSCQLCDQPHLKSFCSVAFGKCK